MKDHVYELEECTAMCRTVWLVYASCVIFGPQKLPRSQAVQHGDENYDPDDDETSGHDTAKKLYAFALKYAP